MTLASGISVRVDDVTVDWVDSLGDVGKYESTEQVAKALIEFLVTRLEYFFKNNENLFELLLQILHTLSGDSWPHIFKV